MRPSDPNTPVEIYSPAARHFHWLTVALVVVMLPLGFYMVWRGNATNFDGLTNTLYDTHKTIGFALLCVIVLRLINRLRKGAPADEPTLLWWHKAASHLTHWGLYLLLLGVPLLGWIGVSLYGARSLFGIVSLPPLAAENQGLGEAVLYYHGWAAIALLALAALHIGAALYHYFIRRDGVLSRMLPSLRRD
jgi:cytochrome b561